MDPLTAATIGSTLLGGIGSLFGGGGSQPLTIDEINSIIGPQALLQARQSIFEGLRRGPSGQAALSNAALQGALLKQSLERQGARIGGGVGAFASAAGSTQQGLAKQNALASLDALSSQLALASRSQALDAAVQSRGLSAQLPSPFERITGGLSTGLSQALLLQRRGQFGPAAQTLFQQGETFPGGPIIGPRP